MQVEAAPPVSWELAEEAVQAVPTVPAAVAPGMLVALLAAAEDHRLVLGMIPVPVVLMVLA
jgi:hypothetical protein